MMKKTRIIVFNFILVSIICGPVAAGESLSEKYLGERLTCLDLIRINDTMVLDDQAILIRDNMNNIYINRLPARCFGLRASGAFSYETSISRLCKQDIIKVLEYDNNPGSVCGLGEFVRIKGVSRLSEAAKMLRDGVLDALVKEGAFETAFPSENKK